MTAPAPSPLLGRIRADAIAGEVGVATLRSSLGRSLASFARAPEDSGEIARVTAQASFTFFSGRLRTGLPVAA